MASSNWPAAPSILPKYAPASYAPDPNDQKCSTEQGSSSFLQNLQTPR